MQAKQISLALGMYAACLRNRTRAAQACELDVTDLTDKLRVNLIDTPGWCPDKSTDIHAQYKEVLRQKGMPEEHAPHMILFCVPVSMLRQFQEDKAKQMSRQLEKLKFDQRFPMRVLPVATKADTESGSDRPELLEAIRKLAQTAFKEAGAIIDEPEWTLIDPNGAQPVRGPSQLSQWIKQTLLSQLDSSEFTGFWRLALAKSVMEHTKEHCHALPEDDSALRLFKSACCTVAAACDREVDLESCAKATVVPEDLPWWVIQTIPTSKSQLSQLLATAAQWLGFKPRGDGRDIPASIPQHWQLPAIAACWLRFRPRVGTPVICVLLVAFLTMSTLFLHEWGQVSTLGQMTNQ